MGDWLMQGLRKVSGTPKHDCAATRNSSFENSVDRKGAPSPIEFAKRSLDENKEAMRRCSSEERLPSVLSLGRCPDPKTEEERGVNARSRSAMEARFSRHHSRPFLGGLPSAPSAPSSHLPSLPSKICHCCYCCLEPIPPTEGGGICLR